MSRQFDFLRAGFLVCVLLALLNGVVGCNSGEKIVPWPVQGSVTMQGKPVAEARITLYSVSPSSKVRPIGITDSQGKFQLTTLAVNDGAPAGDYIVTVERPALADDAGEKARIGPNELPSKFANAATSPLRFTVDGKSDNHVLELKLD